MNDSLNWADVINILLVLVMATVVLVITRRTLRSLINIYTVQSAILAALAVVLYFKTDGVTLPIIAGLTVVTKVILIPYMLRRIRRDLKIHRDVEFRYLTPITSVALSVLLVFVVWVGMPQSLHDLWPDRQIYLSAIIGISVVLIGMIVIFSRRKMITKIIGYLTMENGVLLFGMFVTELPLIIEALILIDLIILVLLATILVFGFNSTIDDFHKRLRTLGEIKFKKRIPKS